MKRTFIVWLLIFMVGYFSTGCEQYSKIRTSTNQKEEIILGYGSWKSAEIQTQIAKYLIEKDTEVNVVVKELPVEELWKALENHEIDGLVCGWFPNIHEAYFQKVQDQVEDLGANYKGARYGLVVPDYVNVADIEELRFYQRNFSKQLHVLDQESVLVDYAENINKIYGLEYQVIPHTEQSLLNVLAEAVRNKRWIVLTGWTPHWMIEKYDLRFLEDTEKVYGDTFDIHTIVSRNLRKKNEKVYDVLNRFKLEPGELEKMMLIAHEKEGKSANEIVGEWIKNF